jgi:hypothetical protein
MRFTRGVSRINRTKPGRQWQVDDVDFIDRCSL